MGKTNETTLSEALSRFVDSFHLRNKLNEVQVVESWKELVGETIYDHTFDIYVKDKTLFVKVDSSVVRQELNFMKRRLVEKINKMFDTTFIDQITIL
jgi:predicted nucleic acid-binding Zn ribbon protein